MAVHLSIGRIRSGSLAVSLVVLVGLAAVAGAVHFLIQPSPEAATAPGPRSAADGRRAAGSRSDGQVETKARDDTELAGPYERAPDADRTAKASAVDAGSAEGASENRAEPAAPQAVASEPLDRIRIDRTHIVGSIDPVNPVYTYEVEQIGVDGIADGDSHQPRSALVPQGQVAVVRRVVEPRDLVAPPTLVAPRNLVEPGSRLKNMAPIPVRAPRRANAGTTARSARTLFERGAEIKLKRDAKVYITTRNIPENDRLLKAYSVDKAAKSSGNAAPGLLGIATQAYRTQGAARTANKTYSLADAMRDALWRKKTAAKLKTLMTARNTCLEDASDSGRSKPSIGLGNTC